jgi:hypothetical protein
MKYLFALMVGLLVALPAAAQMERTPAPENARLYIISPADGEEVDGPVNVKFGLQNMGVTPAVSFQDPETLTQWPNTGHHHIIIDGDLPPMDRPIPADETYVHFGMGQTETILNLEPGEHTLQLILGDAMHFPHDPPVVSEKITIHVLE